MKSLLFRKNPLAVLSLVVVFVLVLAACSPNTNIPVTGDEFGMTETLDTGLGVDNSNLGNTNTGNLNVDNTNVGNTNADNMNAGNLNAGNTNAMTGTGTPTVMVDNTNANANANANANLNANTNANANANANLNANTNANANANANTNAGGIPVTGGEMLAVATDPILGEYLVDSEGMTLYIFTKDQPGVSNCDASCLAQWPPLLAEGESMSTTPGAGNTNAGNTNTGNTNAGNTNTGNTNADNMNVTGVGTPTVVAGGNTNAGNANANANTNANANANTNASGAMSITVTTAGIDQTLIGTAELPDGRTIITYNDWPLYYYVQDQNPGEMRGQGVNGVWWLLSPEGELIGGSLTTETMEPGNANTNAATPVP